MEKAGRRKAKEEAMRPVNQEITVVQVRDDESLGWRGAAETEREERCKVYFGGRIHRAS